MNKIISFIIFFTLSYVLGISPFAIYYHYFFQKEVLLEVKEQEENKKKEVKSEEKETKEESKLEEKKVKPELQEEKEEIPTSWLYSWKGGVCSLLACVIISAISGIAIFAIRNKIEEGKNEEFKIFIFIYFLLSLFISGIISPFVLTFKKFGKKSYLQRLLYSKIKIILDALTVSTGLIGFFTIVLFIKNKKKTTFLITLDPIFHWECKKEEEKKEYDIEQMEKGSNLSSKLNNNNNNGQEQETRSLHSMHNIEE